MPIVFSDFNVSIPVPENPQSMIRCGSTGSRVAYCQNLLNARLMTQPCLWVDGIFGPKTDVRVRQYQAMKGLPVDGIIGPKSWASLEAGPPPIKKM